MTYKEKLKDPRWQKKRLEVFDRDEFRCQICWNDKEQLHAHHKYYKRGNDPWDYPMKAFITLCEDCHSKFHGKKKEITEIRTVKDQNLNRRPRNRKRDKSNIDFFARFK